MKRELSYITFIDILFILLLSVSGGATGVFSEILYYFAFAAPIALGIYFIRIAPKENNTAKLGIKLTRDGTTKTIPLIFPVITLIFSISLLTSLMMKLFGFRDETVIEEALPLAIVLHALIPAVLEEMLFRYIPLRMTLSHSKRHAVLFSALFFSLCHTDLFRIPYAFAAGVLFALVDIMAESVLPSVILHFLNNVLSLVFMEYFGEENGTVFSLILIVLSIISIIPIIIKRKSYRGFFSPLLEKGDSAEISKAPLALVFVTLALAVTNLLSR